MSDRLGRILDVLLHHQATPLNSPYCKCGWRPALSLNDTEADRGQHIGHQGQMIEEALKEEAWRKTKTEEGWVGGPDALPMPDMVITSEGTFHTDGVTPLEITDEMMRAAGWKKVRRQITEWEEVDD